MIVHDTARIMVINVVGQVPAQGHQMPLSPIKPVQQGLRQIGERVRMVLEIEPPTKLGNKRICACGVHRTRKIDCQFFEVEVIERKSKVFEYSCVDFPGKVEQNLHGTRQDVFEVLLFGYFDDHTRTGGIGLARKKNQVGDELLQQNQVENHLGQ